MDRDPICALMDDKDCYLLFTKLLKQSGENTEAIQSLISSVEKLNDALLGSKYSVEAGLIEQIRKHEKRIKVLEVAYIGATAVITVGGVVLGIISKINITF